MTASHAQQLAVSQSAEPLAADATLLRPAASAPSWGWALRRAGLGLAIMVAVTSFAAIIAQASIETAPEQMGIVMPPDSGIKIGLPAAAMLRR